MCWARCLQMRRSLAPARGLPLTQGVGAQPVPGVRPGRGRTASGSCSPTCACQTTPCSTRPCSGGGTPNSTPFRPTTATRPASGTPSKGQRRWASASGGCPGTSSASSSTGATASARARPDARRRPRNANPRNPAPRPRGWAGQGAEGGRTGRSHPARDRRLVPGAAGDAPGGNHGRCRGGDLASWSQVAAAGSAGRRNAARLTRRAVPSPRTTASASPARPGVDQARDCLPRDTTMA
jgi:hypothetical protein